MQDELQQYFEMYVQWMKENGENTTFMRWFMEEKPELRLESAIAYISKIQSLKMEIDALESELHHKKAVLQQLESELPSYQAKPPYHAAHRGDGWYICDSNNIPVMGVWVTRDKNTPPQFVLDEVRHWNA